MDLQRLLLPTKEGNVRSETSFIDSLLNKKVNCITEAAAMIAENEKNLKSIVQDKRDAKRRLSK